MKAKLIMNPPLPSRTCQIWENEIAQLANEVSELPESEYSVYLLIQSLFEPKILQCNIFLTFVKSSVTSHISESVENLDQFFLLENSLTPQDQSAPVPVADEPPLPAGQGNSTVPTLHPFLTRTREAAAAIFPAAPTVHHPNAVSLF